MAYTEEQRRRIAETVRRARIDSHLDKEPAARSAQVNSVTWKRVEDAERVRDASLAKILASLGLPAADVILVGSRASPTTTRVNDGPLVDLVHAGLQLAASKADPDVASYIRKVESVVVGIMGIDRLNSGLDERQ